ncbi:hypothetical protein HMPREF0663_11159 [Hoylesella oralis ATCC 33269]|uniref:Uncharacterized protein n=1 Tax=Hoylesella oralis ATCC 33269 TaxID=873533 RepID=E7RPQ8_9BACT|nr:hypothetical protein HMPREF0663_11159 [Hoylesella oralis ATCC 33269]
MMRGYCIKNTKNNVYLSSPNDVCLIQLCCIIDTRQMYAY